MLDTSRLWGWKGGSSLAMNRGVPALVGSRPWGLVGASGSEARCVDSS